MSDPPRGLRGTHIEPRETRSKQDQICGHSDTTQKRRRDQYEIQRGIPIWRIRHSRPCPTGSLGEERLQWKDDRARDAEDDRNGDRHEHAPKDNDQPSESIRSVHGTGRRSGLVERVSLAVIRAYRQKG